MITDIWIETYDGYAWLHTEEPRWERGETVMGTAMQGHWLPPDDSAEIPLRLRGTALACSLPRGVEGALHTLSRGGPLGAAVTFDPTEDYGLPIHVILHLCPDDEPAHFHLEQTRIGTNSAESGA